MFNFKSSLITIWLILVFGVVTYMFSLCFITPKYISYGSFYITVKAEYNDEVAVPHDESPSDEMLAKSTIFVLKSDKFGEMVKEKIDVSSTVSQLKSMIKVTSGGYGLVEITTKSTSPEYSLLITQTVIDIGI